MVEKMSVLHRVQRLVAFVAEQAFVRDHAADSTALLQAGKRNTRHHILPCCTYFYSVIVITLDGFLAKNKWEGLTGANQ